MSRRKIQAGSQSVTLPIFIQDTSSSTGAGLSSLVFNSSGLASQYRREGSSSWTSISLASGILGSWISGGFINDSGAVAGGYEIGIPNAVVATGVTWAQMTLYGATNMLPVLIEFELDKINYQLNIPNAVWDEVLATHSGVGTAGQTLSSAGSAGDPWGTVLPGAYAVGTAGYAIGSGIQDQTNKIQTFPSNFSSMTINSSGAVLVDRYYDPAVSGYHNFPSGLSTQLISNGMVGVFYIDTDVINSGSVSANAVTEIQNGLSTLNQSDIRSSIGLSTGNLDTQLQNIQTTTYSISGRIPSGLASNGMMKSDLYYVYGTQLESPTLPVNLTQIDYDSLSAGGTAANNFYTVYLAATDGVLLARDGDRIGGAVNASPSPTINGFDVTFSPTSPATEYLNDRQINIYFSGGSLATDMVPRIITNYEKINSTVGRLTIDEPLPFIPISGDNVYILTRHVHTVSQIQSGLSTLSATGVTDAVWGATLPNSYSVGTAGYMLGSGVPSKTNQLTFTIPNQVDATSSASGNSPAEIRAAIGLSSANLDAQLSGINVKTSGIPNFPSNFANIVIDSDGGINAKQYFDVQTSTYRNFPSGLSTFNTSLIDASISSRSTYAGGPVVLSSGIHSGVIIPRVSLVDVTTLNSDMLTQAGIRAAIGLANANLDAQIINISGRLPNSLTDGYMNVNVVEYAGTPQSTGNLPVTMNNIYNRIGLPTGVSISADLQSKPSATDIVSAILAGGDIDGFSVEEACKLMLSALAGKLSGAATTTNTFRAADDSKDRITATVDSDGNRTAITTDATG